MNSKHTYKTKLKFQYISSSFQNYISTTKKKYTKTYNNPKSNIKKEIIKNLPFEKKLKNKNQ